jgi:hypothetical protein
MAGPGIIQGRTVREGVAVPQAAVRLLDCSGEIAGEVTSGADGDFSFITTPGTWTVRAMGGGGSGGRTVTVEAGGGAVRLVIPLEPSWTAMVS